MFQNAFYISQLLIILEIEYFTAIDIMMQLFSLVTAITMIVSSLSAVGAIELPDKDSQRSLRGMNGNFMKGTKKPTSAPGSKIFFSLINAAQETPGCSSTSLGNAILTYMNMELCIRLSYSGLSGLEAASHIHGPAIIGESASVLFSLGPDTNKVECFTLTEEQEGFLKAGLLYFNVHTFPCGH